MFNFAPYYIEANVVCMIVFGILLLHNHFNIDRQEKQIKFDHVLVIFMLYFLVDCFWAAIVGELMPKTRFTMVVNEFLIYILMGATVYSWLNFVMAYEQVPHRNRPINRFAVIFPFIVSTVTLILQYIIAPQTLINEEHDTLPGFSIYMIAVPDIYVSAVLFYTIRKSRAEESFIEKRKHLYIGFLPLMVSVGGLIQETLFPYVPIYCCTCLILMLIFYIQSIEVRISADPLTSLNNRGQLMRYTTQRANLYVEGRLSVVVMMDIDGFKGINDNFGHAQGDKALVLVAESLKTVINRHSMPSFLGRYGGDEFIMILHPERLEEVDQLIAEVREEIRIGCEAICPLSLSAGYDVLLGEHDSVQSCIQRADKKLYLDKEYRKLHTEEHKASA